MKKILLVDDDPLIIRMYEYKLKHEGYNVVLAFDGEEALKMAKEAKPDLMMLDLMMPKMNGVEMMKNLKADKGTANIPVMILTNLSDDAEYVRMTKELGAVDFLVKSETSLKQLVEKIKKAL